MTGDGLFLKGAGEIVGEYWGILYWTEKLLIK